jgi:hypothetical protein
MCITRSVVRDHRLFDGLAFLRRAVSGPPEASSAYNL